VEDEMRLLLLFVMMLFCFNVFADDMDFTRKATGTPELIQTGPQKNWCPVCGMSLKAFYKTSHALKLSGGVNKQYCSMRCMTQDFEGLANIVKEILVVDAKTEKLIDARKAFYVVDSDAPGTMTSISKYAFGDENDAKEFQAKMGGEIMIFDSAQKSAIASMDKDVAMTNMKRQKMMYPKGKMVFNSACDKTIDPFSYNLINELKADIKMNNRCGELKEPELQAVALYLWDVARKELKSEQFITVKEGDKCPVCGMFVHKYPKWASKIVFTKNSEKSYLVFDGVKDQLKFVYNPAKWGDYKDIKITEILVTDYYTNKAVDGKNAFYVIGSDVYGPMGKELIPFSTKKYAETFMADHNGQKILKYDEITSAMVYKLDE